MRTARALAIMVCGLACLVPAHACEVPAGWTPMTGTAGAGGTAAVEPIAQPVPVGRKLDLAVAVCPPSGAGVDRVAVDAIMPAHRHGMNYRPEVTSSADGGYRASGLLFHMPDEWRLTVDAYAGDWSRRFSLDLKAQ